MRKVLIAFGNHKFVGLPVREKFENDELLTAIENCIELITTPMPAKDSQGGMAIVQALSSIPCGTIVELPDNAAIIELEVNSPYALEHTRVTSGIETSKGNLLQMPQVKRH